MKIPSLVKVRKQTICNITNHNWIVSPLMWFFCCEEITRMIKTTMSSKSFVVTLQNYFESVKKIKIKKYPTINKFKIVKPFIILILTFKNKLIKQNSFRYFSFIYCQISRREFNHKRRFIWCLLSIFLRDFN